MKKSEEVTHFSLIPNPTVCVNMIVSMFLCIKTFIFMSCLLSIHFISNEQKEAELSVGTMHIRK